MTADAFQSDSNGDLASVEYDDPRRLLNQRVQQLLLDQAAREQVARLRRGGSPALRDRVLDVRGLLQLPNPEWLVGDLLPETSLAMLVGQPGVFKSFFALGIAVSVASGQPAFGHLVKPGAVLYVAAEGIAGQKARMLAQLDRLPDGEDGLVRPLLFDRGPLDLRDDDQGEELSDFAAEVGAKLVVIDTLARCAPGANENSSMDMGQVINNLDRVKFATGGAVYVVHHSTKTGDSPIRGSSALHGAMDAVHYMLRSTPDVVTVKTVKQKDAPELAPFRLGFHPVAGSDSGVLRLPSLDQLGGIPVDRGDTAKAVVLELVNATPGTSQIAVLKAAKEAGLTESTVRRALDRHVIARQIRREKKNNRVSYWPETVEDE